MDQSSPAVSAARAFRVVHLALIVGLLLLAVVLVLVRQTIRFQLFPSGVAAPAFALAAFALLFVAATMLRRKVPTRRFEQTAETYWNSVETRAGAIVLWAVAQGAGLIGTIGFFLTANPLPLGVTLLALGALVAFRPSRLESDDSPGR